jgi:lipoyl(octanoyl) transferase
MVIVRELGRVPYAATVTAMRELAARVAREPALGEVWLLEHEPVYTAGRATPANDVAAVDAVAIERGGKLTYHGPGQLVVYPIVRLPARDARAWLRRLEAFGVALCGAFGVAAQPSVDGTGVFAGDRKLGSIGVALRGWVNLHGLALNIDLDLAPFFRMRPCGLDPHVMTDLSRAAGRPIAMHEAVAAARAHLAELGLDRPDPLDGSDSDAPKPPPPR